MSNQLLLQIERSAGDTVQSFPLEDQFIYDAAPGDIIKVIDSEGNPVDLPLTREGDNLVLRLPDSEGAAIVKNFFAETEDENELNGIQSDNIEVGLGGEGDGDDTIIWSGAGAKQYDNSFSLIRGSEVSHISFGKGGASQDITNNFGSGGGGGGDNATTNNIIPPTGTPNAAPVAGDDAAGTDEDSGVSINLLANDSDPEGGSLFIQSVEGSTAGSVTLASGAVVTHAGSGVVNYDPGTSFNSLQVGASAVDSFTYQVRDDAGNVSQARVVITITGLNDAPPSNPGAGPGIYDDIVNAAEDAVGPATGNVLANDSDPDGDTLSVTEVNGSSANLGASVTGAFGTIVIQSDGNYSYAVDNTDIAIQALGVGETEIDTFYYLADDGNGGSASATVTVTINGENDAPVSNPGAGPGIYDDEVNVSEEDTVADTGNVLANDSDPDGDTLTVSEVNGSAGNVGATVNGAFGSITIDSDGDYSYSVDNANAAVQALGVGQTAIDTFYYLADDGNGGSASATVTVTINGENDAPVSNPVAGPGIYDDSVTVSEEDAFASTGNVLANDSDPDGDTLTVSEVNGSAGNVGATVNGTFGSITIDSDGDYSYSVDNANAAVQALGVGQTAIDTFFYLADDGNGGSASATVTVTINGENDAPVSNPVAGPGIYDDSVTVSEEDTVAATGNVLANDSDPDGDTLTVSEVNGSAGNVGATVNGTFGSITIDSDGNYSYSVDNANAAVQALGVGQTAIDTFYYLADDGNGGSASATVTVTINGENDAPVSNPGAGPGIYDDSITVSEEDTVAATGNVLANDSDPDGDTLTVSEVNGSAGNVGATVNGTFGSITIDSDGDYSYSVDNANAAVQALGVGQAAIDTFYYLADDGNGGSASATVSVTINGENDAPVSNPGAGPGIYDDEVNVSEEDTVAATGNVLTNDSDPDGDTLTVSEVNGSAGNVGATVNGTFGSITIDSDGDYSYSVDNANAAVQALGVGQTAIDTFYYLADDGNGGSASATVTVTINGENDAPVSNPAAGPGIYDDSVTVSEEDAVASTGNVLANDSDPDGDTLTVSEVNGSAGNVGATVNGTFGSITIDSDGDYSYSVDNANAAVQALGVGQTAIDTFYYLADDGNGGSASATVTVTINGENDAPVSNPGAGPGIYDDSATMSEEDVAPATGNVLANDSDPDGDTLTVSAVNGSAGNVGNSVIGSFGTITIDSDGDYSYSLDNANATVQALGVGQTAIDTFYYLADDGNGGSASATVSVTINGENDAPTSNPSINDDSVSIDEDDAAPATGNVLANDSDADGDTLTVSAVNGSAANVGNSVNGSFGSITIDSDGDYSYSVDNANAAVQALGVGQTAIDTFYYLADDGNGGSASATVTVTINGENDAPVSNPGAGPGIYDDSVTVSEEDTVAATGNVLANDSDPDGDSLTVTAVNGVGANVGNTINGSFGSISIGSDGNYSYSVDNANAAVQALGVGQTAIDTFSYLADDRNGGSASATVTVTITGENDAPVSNPGAGPGIYDDSVTVSEEDTVAATGNVLANDSDPDGDSLTVTAVNGNAANVNSLIAGSFGSVTIDASGAYSYSVDNANAAVQALGVGQTAIDTFTYLADDGNGGSASATLTVTINGENDAPVSNPGSGPGIYDDSAVISEEDVTPVTGNVLSNDSDPDGDSLTVTAVNGVAGNVNSSLAGSFGSVTINDNGTYSYTVDNANAAVQALGVGQTAIDSFTYLADDDNGGSAAATLTVTITGENDAPPSNPGSGPGIYDDSVSISEEDVAAATGNVLANDSDPDGDSLTVTLVNGSAGNVNNSLAGSFGLITINDDGTYSYTLDNANATVQALGVGQTEIDTFTYVADDGNGGSANATLSVTINGENDAPTSNPSINDDTDSIFEEDPNPATGNVLANDSDPDGDSLTVSAVQGSAGNVGNSIAGSFGTITINANGTYSYSVDNSDGAVQALNDGDTLTDTFTYVANDGNGGSAGATLTVTINGRNEDSLVVNDDSVSISEEDLVAVTGNVLANDSDPDGDPLTVTEVNSDAGNVDNTISGSFGSITINADGSYSYSVDNANTTVQALGVGQTEIDIFTYVADDGSGNFASASVVVTINGENDAPPSNPGSGPGIYDDSASINEDDVAPVTGSVLANDSDPDGDALTVTIVNGSAANVNNSLAGSFGSVTINDDGSYSYIVDNGNAAVQALGVGQTAIDSFTYVADDGNGGSAAATLTVTVNGVNDAPPSNPGVGPGIYNDSATISEEDLAPVTGNVLANDSDPDGDTLTVTAVNGSGANVDDSIAGSFGSITINDDGSYSYILDNANAAVQALGVGQTAIDTFSYVADDGNGGSASASILVTINGENDAPPSNPGTGPGIYDDSASINEDEIAPATGDVLANDSDPDGDALTVTIVNGSAANVNNSLAGSFGSITINDDGTYSYIVDNGNAAVQALGVGQTAIDSFTYVADDGNGGSAAATLTVTVNGVNDAPPSNPGAGPGIYDDSASINEDDLAPVTGNVLANDSDPDGDSLTVTAVDGLAANVGNSINGSFGSITIGSDGNYSYTVNNASAAVQALGVGETVIDTFSYLADDGNGGSASASILVTINGINDAPPSNPGAGPGIYDDSASIDEDDVAPATGDVLANDSDPDGDSLTVTLVGGSAANVNNSLAGSFGSVTINDDGTYSYTVDNGNAAVQALGVGQTAIDSFTYVADDGNGGSAAATLSVTINGVNDAPPSNPGSGPGIYDDSASINEDDVAAVTGDVLANDSDPDGDALTVSAVNGVAGNVGANVNGAFGTISILSDGSYSYSVDNGNASVQALGVGQTAIDTFTYIADDGNGGSASASILVTINGVNDTPPSNPGSGPGIYDDSVSINEDDVAPATGDVLANDSDPDGDALTVTIVNGSAANVNNSLAGSFGSVTINDDGSYSYIVDNGNAAVQALGVGQTAIDSFTYVADDGNGGSAAATLTVTVNGVNDAPPPNPGVGPGIYNDSATISEEDLAPVTGNVLANDSDPDGDTLTVTAVNGSGANVDNSIAGSFGSITINSDGTYSYSLDNANAAVQALGVGQTAIDTFTYVADDGNGGSASASILVTINGENDAPPPNPGSGPGIYDDSASIDEDDVAPATGDVLANDSDPDGDSLTVTQVNGSAGNVNNSILGVFGSITINDDGTYSYTLDNGNAAVQALGVGETEIDSFTYVADDGNGGSAMATLSVTVNGVNDAPPPNPGSGPGIYDDFASVNEEDVAPVTGDVLANDSDPDGDTLTVTSINGSAGNVGNSVNGAYGSIVINGDGTYSYNLNNADPAVQALEPGDTATETFTYVADDGNGGSAAATLTITINGELDNEAPVAVDDYQTGFTTYDDSMDADGSFDSLLNLDLELDALSSSGWEIGDGTPESLVGADVSLDLLGLLGGVVNGLTSSPQGGVFIGLNSLTGDSIYTNLTNLTPGQTYTVRMLQANVGVAGLGGSSEGDLVGLRVVMGDETQYTTPTPYDGEGDQLWVEQTLTFTADSTEERLEIFADDTDGSGGLVAVDAVLVTEADADANGYDFAPIDLLENDYDVEGDDFSLTHIDGQAVAQGDTVTLSSGNTVTFNYDGTVTFDDDNAPLDVGESEVFTYTISDEWGQTDTATVTMERTNDAPVAVDDYQTGYVRQEDSLDADGSFDSLLNLDLELDALTTSGWEIGDGTPESLVGADVSLDLLGLLGGVINGLTSSPQGGVFIGLDAATGDSIYTNLTNLTPGQTYTVRLLQANVGVGGLFGSSEGDLVGLRVVMGDETQYTTPTPYDGEGDQLWVEQTLTFTADSTEERLEIFADDTDGSGGLIAVDAVIVTAADAGNVGYDFAPIDLLANDYDTEGDEFTLTQIDGQAVVQGDTVTLSSGNTVTFNYDGTVTFDDDNAPLDVGESETFTYTISDEWGQTDTATVTMERPAFAGDDTYDTTNGRIEANVLENDDDSYGALTVIDVSATDEGGTVSMNADGTFTYVGAPGYTGPDSFTYTVQSTNGETDVATVTLNVDPPGTPTYGNLNIAIVVDESGSIATPSVLDIILGNTSESQHIQNGLNSFINSMQDTGNTISLIGMGDSDVNVRADHVIEQQVTAATIGTFQSWISDYRNGRVGIESDYWASGLQVAASGLSETPDVVLIITDGAQGTKTLASSWVSQLESNGSHVFAIGAETGIYWGDASATLEEAVTDVVSSNPVEGDVDLSDIMTTDYQDGGFAELSTSLANVGPALEDFFTPTVPPVVIDMDNDGVEFDSVEDGIAFDVDGDGELEQTAWANEDDAVLVYDHDQDGDVTARSEIAFADYLEGAESDLEGLLYFDTDGDGKLDADDAEFAKFALWQDANGDGLVSEGEMFSLLEAGVESIELHSDQNAYSAAGGDVTVHGEAQVHYIDGSTGIAADAEFDFEEMLDDDGFAIMTEDGETLHINAEDNQSQASHGAIENVDMPAPPIATVDDQELTQ